MAIPLLFVLAFLSISINITMSESRLTVDYYRKTCPDLESVVSDIVFNKQQVTPTTAAGVLRLFFHDCFLDGCDASVLVSSTAFNKAERDADINLSLSGDGYEVISRAKTALELRCPGVVSCADILALATRDLIKITGGPYYQVRFGRKDSLVSKVSDVGTKIPTPNMTMDNIISRFTSKGFTIKDVVALSGAHTIGLSHCKEFSYRIFNYSNTSSFEPGMNPKYVQALRNLCGNFTKDPSMSVFNDLRSPSTFNNDYYQNILQGAGLLQSDHMLGFDPRTRPIVELYARDQNTFFRDFAHAIEKLSVMGVKIGKHGEVRNKCNAFNNS